MRLTHSISRSSMRASVYTKQHKIQSQSTLRQHNYVHYKCVNFLLASKSVATYYRCRVYFLLHKFICILQKFSSNNYLKQTKNIIILFPHIMGKTDFPKYIGPTNMSDKFWVGLTSFYSGLVRLSSFYQSCMYTKWRR
jgi:hypothetical protein